MKSSKELAESVNQSAHEKVKRTNSKVFALSVLAGIYIAFGAIFFTTVTAYGGHPSFVKIVGGVAFSLGLILVVIAGAELFTGNNLMVIPYLNRKIEFNELCKNWVIVYIGNFVGSMLMVLLVFISKQYLEEEAVVGQRALGIASAKVNLDFMTAFTRAILCNILVCLAVRLAMTAKSMAGKILGIVFPISAFVVMGFEHSVANMFFIPMGIFIKRWAPMNFWSHTSVEASSFVNLNWSTFFIHNLLPVTLGNIVGGVFFVGLVYWFVSETES